MIGVAQFEFAVPSEASPGSILVQASRKPMYAAMMAIGGGGPRNAMTIGDQHGFRIVDMSRAGGVFLAVKNPRFLVDPASSVGGFDHSPEPGTLFVTPRGPGILAIADHAELGVLLSGEIVADIDFGKFAGFRHWRLEVGEATDTTHVLFTRRVPDRQEGS
jgi:hypothetical protein